MVCAPLYAFLRWIQYTRVRRGIKRRDHGSFFHCSWCAPGLHLQNHLQSKLTYISIGDVVGVFSPGTHFRSIEKTPRFFGRIFQLCTTLCGSAELTDYYIFFTRKWYILLYIYIVKKKKRNFIFGYFFFFFFC